jgi:hypothetical protein
MGVVAWQLARAAIIDFPTLVIVIVSTALLLRFRVNSVWLIAAPAHSDGSIADERAALGVIADVLVDKERSLYSDYIYQGRA